MDERLRDFNAQLDSDDAFRHARNSMMDDGERIVERLDAIVGKLEQMDGRLKKLESKATDINDATNVLEAQADFAMQTYLAFRRPLQVIANLTSKVGGAIGLGPSERAEGNAPLMLPDRVPDRVRELKGAHLFAEEGEPDESVFAGDSVFSATPPMSRLDRALLEKDREVNDMIDEQLKKTMATGTPAWLDGDELLPSELARAYDRKVTRVAL
jgi:hypothetical protein